MTTELDPIRWTESSEDAPELLRAPFAAATREGPSPVQMRMLAVKLAAVAAGATVTAGAAGATAQASATASSTLAGGASVSAALPFAKIVAAMAIVGAGALGGVALLNRPSGSRVETRATREEPTSVEMREPAVEAAAQGTRPVLAVEAPSATQQQLTRETATLPGEAKPATESVAQKRAPITRAAQGKARHARAVRASAVTSRQASVPAAQAPDGKVDDVPSEVELLRRARTALATRPREAFALTEQHREHYARGVFAQERDAIAIEALLRAGDTEAARSLAKRFVSAHPSSAHAHRFRETLGLQ